MQGRRFVFTLNNYTDDEVKAFNEAEAKYICYGKEVGEGGTPHLQGCIVFSKPKRLAFLKRLSSRAHWEPMRGTTEEASDYCKKDGDYTERGSLPNEAGKRNDLETIYQEIREGATEKQIAEKYPSQWTLYYKAFNRYRSLISQPLPVEKHPLKEWQADLFRLLKLEADDRTVHFVVDKIGNAGKSWFCGYCYELLNDCQLIKPGKYADMAYELLTTTRILFIDCSRSKTEHLNYDFLESVKDLRVFSPKYESTMKYMAKKVHVVVMMNEEPDMTKLSHDRYNIIII